MPLHDQVESQLIITVYYITLGAEKRTTDRFNPTGSGESLRQWSSISDCPRSPIFWHQSPSLDTAFAEWSDARGLCRMPCKPNSSSNIGHTSYSAPGTMMVQSYICTLPVSFHLYYINWYVDVLEYIINEHKWVHVSSRTWPSIYMIYIPCTAYFSIWQPFNLNEVANRYINTKINFLCH